MRASSMQPEKLVRQLVSESACGVLVCSDENAIQRPDPLEFGTPHEGAVAQELLVVQRRAGSTHGRHVMLFCVNAVQIEYLCCITASKKRQSPKAQLNIGCWMVW